MTVAEPTTRRWTRDEYYRLAEQGLFEGQRVQLIHGEIIQMPPQGQPHVAAVFTAERVLRSIFEPADHVRAQFPLNVGADSDPEPDLAVVAGQLTDYSDHPTTAKLVVEVADSTLRLDRRKASLYAAGGIPEYWIVNLKAGRLEVYRDPEPAEDEEFGYHYASRQILAKDQVVSPLACPEARINVADLLPVLTPKCQP